MEKGNGLHKRLLLLVLLLVACAVGYMTLGARGGWDFILAFRGAKLASLLLVGTAMSTATLLFQTITTNRILTPSIMGFDGLFMLILTVLVLTLGGHGYMTLGSTVTMLVNVTLLCGASLLLFGAVLKSGRNDIMRLILTGVVLSVMFRSITSFLQRAIDPNEYEVIQAASFARFSKVETDLLGIAAVLTLVALMAAWRMRYRLDVLALGPVPATSLGEDPLRGQRAALIIISVLVSVSTALVGPVAFFGLLVTSLTYILLPTHRHAVLLPGAALVSGIILVGGQTVMERALALTTPLGVVVEFAGGLIFLILLLRSLRA